MPKFTSLSHEFDNGWKLTGNYSYLTGKSDTVSGIAGTSAINTKYAASFTSDRDRSKYRDQNFSLILDGDYPALGRSHEFNAGISYQDNKGNLSFYKKGYSTIPDLRKFDGDIAKPDMPYLRDGFADMKNLSIYGSTRFKLTDKLAFIGGGRFVDWQYRYSSDSNDFADSRYKNKVFIPYLGASYDLNDNLTAYTSYTTIFHPQVYSLDQNSKPLEPQRGKAYETGLKGSWFDGRLNASTSVFMNKRDHVGVYAGRLNGKEYYRYANKTTTKGWELAVGGRLSDKWLLNASYARSKIKDSEGKQLNLSYPVHLFKLFTAYDVTDRLNLGANVNWQSLTHTLDEYPADINPAAAAALTQRPYATLDLTAHYKIGKSTRIGLEFENVFNKRYRPMPDIHIYGTPRSLTATVKHTF